MAEHPASGKPYNKMTRKQASNELYRAIKEESKLIKELRKLERHEQLTKDLAYAAEVMRDHGASPQSMRTALTGLYEYWKITGRSPSVPLDLRVLINPSLVAEANAEALGTMLSEVDTREVLWLWESYIPLGKITILDGDPGMGKSLLAINIAALVSTGQSMPDGTPGKEGSVILIAPEDGAQDTLKPRLEAAGGDPSKVLLLNMVAGLDTKKAIISDRSFSLADHIAELEQVIKHRKAILVILDPLMAILGHRISSSRDQDIREVFTPLAQLAERTGAAILIIRHLNKLNSDNQLYRGAGSIGIIAAARIGLVIHQDPFNEHLRVLATTKNNLTSKASNLTFQVVENERKVPYIQWLGETHHTPETFIPGVKVSARRQEILNLLRASTTPLTITQVVNRTDQNYMMASKTLSRMHAAGEIASPSRGLYTALDHPCLTRHVTQTDDVPMEPEEQLSKLSNVSNVSNVSQQEAEPTACDQSPTNIEQEDQPSQLSDPSWLEAEPTGCEQSYTPLDLEELLSKVSKLSQSEAEPLVYANLT